MSLLPLPWAQGGVIPQGAGQGQASATAGLGTWAGKALAGRQQVDGRPGPQVLCPGGGAGPMTFFLGCQPAVCSGGHRLAQLRDPGVSALGQRRVRLGAPCATFLLTHSAQPGARGLSSHPRGPAVSASRWL